MVKTVGGAGERACENGHQGRLPVVRVDDVIRNGRFGRPVERRLTQEREAFRIVDVVVAVDAVEIVPVEVAGVVDEDRPHAAIGRHHAAGVRHKIPERDGQHAFGRAGVDPAVSRHHDVDVVTKRDEGPGQSPDDIGQPTGLGEGNRLRRDHQDPHPHNVTATQPLVYDSPRDRTGRAPSQTCALRLT